MTVEDIFAKVIHHQLEGVMFHDDMSKYYRFLGLCGYAEDHKNRFIEESHCYTKMCEFYMENYGKIPKELPVEKTNYIPSSWYAHTRMDVDTSTKRSAVKSGLEKWVEWETKTKDIYQKMIKELADIGEVRAAIFLGDILLDVCEELSDAQRYLRIKMDLDFAIEDIISDQERTTNE